MAVVDSVRRVHLFSKKMPAIDRSDPWFEAKGFGARSWFGSPSGRPSIYLSSVLVSVSFLGFWVCALLFTATHAELANWLANN